MHDVQNPSVTEGCAALHVSWMEICSGCLRGFWAATVGSGLALLVGNIPTCNTMVTVIGMSSVCLDASHLGMAESPVELLSMRWVVGLLR